ncbi:MAG: hypothetical protein WDZ35_09230 [Crocinitomicaceae bacterium]
MRQKKKEEEYKLDLSKFRKHQRSIPWGLIRKVFIAIVFLVLFYYLFNTLQEKPGSEQKADEGIEIELVD